MRVLQLIYVAALVLRCAAVKTATKPHTTSTVKINSEADAVSRVLATQTTRSLRQFDQEKLAEDDDEDEERGFSISGPVETIVTKARTGLKSVLTKISIERVLLASQLSERYPYAQGLSLSTLKQLATIEKLRKIDIEKGIKGSKLTPGSMRQRFGRDGSRLLSAGVVTRVNEKGEHQMLLISSSNPKKSDFLPPKGGWDKGESIKKAALREVIEEGGVSAQLAHGLGKVKFQDGENKYTYFAYLMRSNKIYDDWSESTRYRLWVPMDDALKMLAGRPQLAEVVKRAKIVEGKIASGKMPVVNPKLAKDKLG
ncbi:NUDIX domain-containing protein [Phytophthora infestans]|uniref:RxLR effector protein n=1 Tax=Phytophthora infestans TaxID=4787 RepID=A0A833TPX1_PHYIN|nr:NUDIX domain-containing protein [Phytophthora infestans]